MIGSWRSKQLSTPANAPSLAVLAVGGVVGVVGVVGAVGAVGAVAPPLASGGWARRCCQVVRAQARMGMGRSAGVGGTRRVARAQGVDGTQEGQA